jgi:hypothetical protein
MLIEYKTYNRIINTSRQIIMGSEWQVNDLKCALWNKN